MPKPFKQKKSYKVVTHKLDWLEWIAIGLSLWFMFYPHPYKALFTVVLLLPILGLIINGISRPSLASLITITKKEDDIDVADFIDFPAIAISFRVLIDYEYESFFSIIKVGTVGFIICLVLLSLTHKRIDHGNKDRFWMSLLIIANIALYSYAATYGINCVYDTSEAKIYHTKVLGKSISRGRRSTTYYLRVKPWGTHREAEKISVALSQYSATSIGQTVNIDYKKGLLGIPWYFIE